MKLYKSFNILRRGEKKACKLKITGSLCQSMGRDAYLDHCPVLLNLWSVSHTAVKAVPEDPAAAAAAAA